MIRSLRALFFMINFLICCGLAVPGRLGAENSPAEAEATPFPAGCVFPGLSLPPETEVYAVVGRGGRPLGWNIDYDQDRNPTLIKVAVNSPQAPVALILGAIEPNVWQIGWTEGTTIAAVAVGGRYRQAVSGLPPEVPVVMGGWEGEPGRSHFCGPFYVSHRDADLTRILDLSRRLFSRKLKNLATLQDGRAVVGQSFDETTKVLTGRNLIPGDFKTPPDFPEGEEGLGEALRRGLIKPASWVELRQWRRAAFERDKKAAEAEGRIMPAVFEPDDKGDYRYVQKGFLVVSPDFVIPGRLELSSGAMYNFYVPPGMDRPAGPLGKQTRILFMADGTELSGSPDRSGK